jgi:ABC-type bacteriocin/lantibiotic exporter with double-glycine peptidase domain
MQQESVECGATCLAMVLAYYGRWVSPEELRELCGVSRDGTQSSSILRAARSFGLIAKGFSKTTADLANLPLPMILFWNFNHFVVLESISEKGAWINDPATGPRRVSMEEVDTAFTGVVLAFQPTEAFTPGGSRASLFSVIAANLATVKTGIIFAVLAGIGLLVPGIFTAGSYRIFTDEILVGGRSTWLAPLLVGLGIAALLAGALTWMQRQAQSRTETALGASIAVRYLWTLLGLPLSFFGQRYSGDIVNRLTQADRMASLIATGLVPALIGLVPILGFGAVLFLRRWQGAKAQVLGAEQRSAERSGLINETATLLLAVAGIAVLIAGVGARLQSIRGISDRLPEEQYVAAAQDARIHDFISSRPGGYASVLMENGNNLSGGERQRLALARALTINPRILVLDEATSALDPVTEAAVMEAIWRRGCTCIVIAHRLSSIMDSDMILVMDKGRVVETGSHQAAILPGSIWPRSAVKSGTCGRGGGCFRAACAIISKARLRRTSKIFGGLPRLPESPTISARCRWACILW